MNKDQKKRKKLRKKYAKYIPDVLYNEEDAYNNREMNVVSFLFVAIFAVMIIYLIYFKVAVAPDIIDNPYNKRVDNQEQKVVRGDILANDGTVLATTKKDDNGAEYRHYPYNNMFSHVVGIKSEETGIEGLADFELLSHSDDFMTQLWDDVTGKKMEGNSVVSTLDFNLQKTAWEALGNNKGAIVVMEPATGNVLAMVSKPDFNPNESPTKYNEWLSFTSEDSVLLNRATSGLYAPGSTFKVITALEYVIENAEYDAFSYNCQGTVTVDGGTTIPCNNMKAHGDENLKRAFAVSCNCAFSVIGTKLNRTSLSNLTDKLLFNKHLDIGIESAKSSFVLGENSSLSEAQETAIGQGNTMISPMHNLMITAAIANNGVMMQPNFIREIRDCDGKVVDTIEAKVKSKIVEENYSKIIKEYMRGVVTEGTASAFRNVNYEVAGKTGTAQYGTQGLSHSWFTGFAPYNEPQIAVCVILEGGYQGQSAQYVAKKVMERYFNGN
ncbi:MAG: penicillin-binding protein 2 [Lachnospira sp.]|nr:penicillin-binding protein 2 [Lachnospira sp.]